MHTRIRAHTRNCYLTVAHVAQSVERFLGKEEVHRFDSGRGLHRYTGHFRACLLGAAFDGIEYTVKVLKLNHFKYNGRMRRCRRRSLSEPSRM